MFLCFNKQFLLIKCFLQTSHLQTFTTFKQVRSPVCGDVLKVFVHACHFYLVGVNNSFSVKNVAPHTCLRQWSRVNFCSADSSRVRQTLGGASRKSFLQTSQRFSPGCVLPCAERAPHYEFKILFYKHY